MQRTYDFFPRKTVQKAADTLMLRSSTKPGVVLKGPHAVSFQRMLQSDLYVVKALHC